MNMSRESGRSLIEVLIAVSLLVTVLVPATTGLVRFTTVHAPVQQVRGLAIAQTSLERLMAGHPLNAPAGWQVEADRTAQPPLVRFRVTVRPAERPHPEISLQTTRLASEGKGPAMQTSEMEGAASEDSPSLK